MKITPSGILTIIILLVCILALGATAHCQTVHGVTLTWTQSTTPSVAFNTVYQSPTSTGTYTKLFTSAAPITTYFIPLTGTLGGTSQCWVVTATVNSVESVPSASACATFPLLTSPPTGLSASPN